MVLALGVKVNFVVKSVWSVKLDVGSLAVVNVFESKSWNPALTIESLSVWRIPRKISDGVRLSVVKYCYHELYLATSVFVFRLRRYSWSIYDYTFWVQSSGFPCRRWRGVLCAEHLKQKLRMKFGVTYFYTAFRVILGKSLKIHFGSQHTHVLGREDNAKWRVVSRP